MVKVGTLDDPSMNSGSQSNAQLTDAKLLNHVDPLVPGYQRWP
jgi:hypothetical protein